MWLILILVLIGVLLLVAELVLLPGISVAGIGSLLAFGAAIFYAFIQYGVLGSAVSDSGQHPQLFKGNGHGRG